MLGTAREAAQSRDAITSRAWWQHWFHPSLAAARSSAAVVLPTLAWDEHRRPVGWVGNGSGGHVAQEYVGTGGPEIVLVVLYILEASFLITGPCTPIAAARDRSQGRGGAIGAYMGKKAAGRGKKWRRGTKRNGLESRKAERPRPSAQEAGKSRSPKRGPFRSTTEPEGGCATARSPKLSPEPHLAPPEPQISTAPAPPPPSAKEGRKHQFQDRYLRFCENYELPSLICSTRWKFRLDRPVRRFSRGVLGIQGHRHRKRFAQFGILRFPAEDNSPGPTITRTKVYRRRAVRVGQVVSP